MQTCKKCNETKPMDKFEFRKDKGFYRGVCRTCKGRVKLPYRNAWRKGITVAVVEAARERQGGVCAICGCAEKLVIDHCHSTMKFRGLLCASCNWGLGHFKDNKDSLAKAIEYLEG